MATPTDVILVVSGQTVTELGRIGSVLITDELNDAPNSATLTTKLRANWPASPAFFPDAFDAGGFNVAPAPAQPFRPPVGAPVQIYLGSVAPEALLFGGELIVLQQVYEADQPAHVAFHLSCVDFTRRGNRKQVVKQYAQQSATAIVLDLVATYTDLTATNVQAGLPTVEGGIALTFEDLSRALSRVAEKIGASWYWDYVGDLHFFLEEAATAPAPIVPGGAPFADFQIISDITQVRTRILVEGMGSTVLANVAAGATVIPIADASMFPTAGTAKLGPAPQRVTYTGVVLGGAAGVSAGVSQAPIAGIAAVQAGGVSGDLTGGPYHWLWTAVQGRDESNYLGISGPVTIAGVTAPVTGGTVTQNNTAGGTLRGGGNYYSYGQSFLTADGGETLVSAIGSLAPASVVMPGPGIYSGIAATTGGALAPATYYYGVSYVTASGETALRDGGGSSVLVGVPNNAVNLTGLIVPTDPRVTGKRLYRFVSTGIYRLVADLAPGATSHKDTIATEALGGQHPTGPPEADGAAANVPLKVSPDARVVGRRLYQAPNAPISGGSQIADIRNNTQTTYVDTGGFGSGGQAPSVATAVGGAVDVTVPAGPAGTTARKLYRTKSGDPSYRLVQTLSGNTAATIRDTKADDETGDHYVDASTWPTPAGATSLPVTDLAGFPPSGYLRIGGQTIAYSGRSGTSGPGTLTGIPSTGRGAIVSPIPSGASAAVAPQLTGVAGLLLDLNIGDECYLLVIENDTAAQAAMAALEGGDGIIEHYIQDRRLSEAGARARARAELELFKAVEIKISYVTWDPLTRSGQTVHVDLPPPTNLTGDFLIQSVTIDAIDQYRSGPAARLYPRRRVTASSTRFTFDNVLQRLLMEET